MIKVEKEPIGVEGVERCCFCRKQTRTWYHPKDVAVCVHCAKVANDIDVPSKAIWCRRERIATSEKGEEGDE